MNRFEEDVKNAINKTVEVFGGIDILINNAGAVNRTNVEKTTMKKYDLMSSINARAAFMCAKYALPYLKQSTNPHILNIAPPFEYIIENTHYSEYLAYSLSKFAMTLQTYGMAEEFKEFGIACNTLWPKRTVATAAIKNLIGGDPVFKRALSPSITGDASYYILTSDSRKTTGKYYLDDEVLISIGETDLMKYAPENITRS